VRAGDWAFCRGRESVTATPWDGGPPVTLAGRRALSILKKGEDGIWRFARGISNDGPKVG
jgi:ketosteroid isomerase-like protein